jgi:hypothetical protein
MIDPTEDEISFLRKIELRDGNLVLQGNLSLLKIERLIPDYVTRVITSVDTAVFSLTDSGRRLLEAINQDDLDSRKVRACAR